MILSIEKAAIASFSKTLLETLTRKISDALEYGVIFSYLSFSKSPVLGYKTLIKLISLRALPLMLRPMAILLEGSLIGERALVLTLPVAMFALTISSVPVYLDYHKSNGSAIDRLMLREEYVSAVTWLTFCSSFALFAISALLPLSLSIAEALIVALIFMVEKFSAEASRLFEFQKEHGKWARVQILRCGWVFVPIACAMAGASYVYSVVICAMCACVLMVLVFTNAAGLRLQFGRNGPKHILKNSSYVLGSVLPASYIQAPRIFVARAFPDEAHIYLAISQLAQGAALMFNVRYQIPYRKVIAMRTRAFHKASYPIMLRIMAACATISALYLATSSILYPTTQSSGAALAIALMPIAIVESIVFAIMVAHLGYIPWLGKRYRSLIFYIASAALIAAIFVILPKTNALNNIPLTSIPALTAVFGCAIVISIKSFLLPDERKGCGRTH